MANSSGALEPQAAFDTQPEIFQGQPCQRLTLPSGDSVLVALQGAHVLSWVAQGRERLFLSERNVWDGQAAIRGGVPVCFPQFNQRGDLPKHGFARNVAWQLVTGQEGGNFVDAAREHAKQELVAANTRDNNFASGGLSNMDDIEKLCEVEEEGVEGVICGRAIYSGDLDFEKAQARADDLNG